MPALFAAGSADYAELQQQHNAPNTITDLLLDAARRYPHTGVRWLSDDTREDNPIFVTHPALLAKAQRLLGGLQAHRRQPGTKVALLLEQAGDFIPAFWACLLGGYVPCPMTPIRNDSARWVKQLAYVRTLLDDPLLITSSAVRNELSGLETSVDIDTVKSAMPSRQIWAAQPNDPAMMILTSESTGNSKAVVLTHHNLLSSLSGKNQRQQLTSTDVTLNWISFDQVAALIEGHLLPLYVGAVQLHVDSRAIVADPLLFLRLLDQYRVSMTFAPNFLFAGINAALQESLSATPYRRPMGDLSCVRHIISGGEAIVVETGRQFLDLLAPYGLSSAALWPAFGMTETCAGAVYSFEFPDSEASREFASLGFPITGLQMRVVDENGTWLLPGQFGELQLRGPMIFSRYHNNEEATQAAFTRDGWFRTGDRGRIEHGRLSLTGRSKGSILVKGVN